MLQAYVKVVRVNIIKKGLILRNPEEQLMNV
jgi:hypothetical protein